MISPFARLEWADIDIDGFTERMSNPGAPGSGLATRIESQSLTTLPLSLGVQVGTDYRTAWGRFHPRLLLAWVHEFENDAEDIVGRFVDDTSGTPFRLPTDRPDRDFAQLAVGGVLELSERASLQLSYQTVLGMRHLSLHAGQLAFRYRW